MTLFKQIALTVSLITITLLSSVMYVNYQSTKTDIIDTLYQTAVNNISTLSTKIADASEDNAIIASTIDSEFDSGYYNKISFESNLNNFKYTQIDHEKPENIPNWFIKITNLNIEPITIDVTNGWSILGKLTVIADKNIAYNSLYKVFINLIYLFIIYVSISLTLLYIIIHFILKPLKSIQNQAESIVNNEFVIQKKIPFTVEFKDVVKAMNTMVKKVEEIFIQSTKVAKENKELLYIDPTTKLYNRRYLMLKILDTIKLENKLGGGSAILIRLDGAEILNTKLGRQKVDNIFLQLANIFKESTNNIFHNLIARINATEFILILPNFTKEQSSIISNTINSKFNQILNEQQINSKNIYLTIAIYQYNSNITIKNLLTHLDSAIDIAKAKEDSNLHIYKDSIDHEVLAKEQWREIIDEAMNNNNFVLRTWKCINTNKNTLNHNVITFTIKHNNINFMYGDFMPPTISLGLVSSMYILVLEKILKTKQFYKSNVVFRLSNEFLQDINSLNKLENLFDKFCKNNINLIFEVHNIVAINNIDVLKTYIKLFNKFNYKFAINSFTNESNDFNYLRVLKPIYLKSDCKFLFDQPSASINSINTLTNTLDIKLIATYVTSIDEINKLKHINIFDVQGPITDKLIKD
jgi:diguanylate cyclase (GGDEF)-like protein